MQISSYWILTSYLSFICRLLSYFPNSEKSSQGGTRNFKWDPRELPMFSLHLVSKKFLLNTCESIEIHLGVLKVFWEIFFSQERQTENLIWAYCRKLLGIRNNPKCENNISKYFESLVKCMYIIKDHFLFQSKQNEK